MMEDKISLNIRHIQKKRTPKIGSVFKNIEKKCAFYNIFTF